MGLAVVGALLSTLNRVDLVTSTYNIATGTYSISDNDVTVDGGGLLAKDVGVLNIQTNNFTNNSSYPGVGVSADTFNLSVAGDFNSRNAGIVADTFALSVAGDFNHINYSYINVNIFNLSLAGDFNHIGYSNINANTFNFSVAGDFDKIVNYRADNDTFYTNNNGRININALNLNVGGDFTFSASANNLTWRANDTLTVSGTANITAASFNNSGTIDVNNSFNATVDTFINEAGATISAFGECNIVYTTSYTDDGTIICQDFVAATIVIDIAAPVDGLSDNQVDSFDVNANGAILNNSAGGGTAQLGTTVTGNGNITAGNEADLILFQVTGSTGSALNGTIEVFGTEAGLIIANPNGIDCDGCGFINTNRVDLVTGSNYDFNTNTFGSIAASDINIASSGLTASVLKIQTGADFINAGTINADTVTIEVTNFANDITNTGTVSATSLNFILTDSFTNGDDSFNGFNFSNLAIKTFSFSNNGKITVNSFTFEGDYFANSGIDVVIDAASFTVTATNTFRHELATINADSFNVIAGTYSANRSTVNADNFTVTANEFGNRNLATINADTVTIEVPDFVDVSNVGGTVSSDSLNFIFTDNFDSSSNFFPGFNNFSNVAITESSGNDFTNGRHTNSPYRFSKCLHITANTFTNNSGPIDVDNSFNITTTASFNNSGTINVTNNSFNATAR